MSLLLCYHTFLGYTYAISGAIGAGHNATFNGKGHILIGLIIYQNTCFKMKCFTYYDVILAEGATELMKTGSKF